MPQTSIEKIAQRHAVGLEPGEVVRAGSFVVIRPKHVMTHDNTGAIIPKFEKIGAKAIADPSQPVFAMDHDVQNTSPENLGKYAKIQKFAGDHGIDYYPPGRGIAHQVMVEEGYVTPGSMVVGSDSHSNLYGASGALGTPVVRTDAAALWATGTTWWQVPDVARVELKGRLPEGASGKDVIITLCGHFNNDEALNCAVEFHGDGVAHLSADERMTISNMTTEWGALVGMFPFDEIWRDYMFSRADHFANRGDANPRYTRTDVERMWAERGEFAPDEDAFYSKTLTLDLSTVSPHVSGPDTVKDMTSIAKMERDKVKIDRAYLMSCVNARLSDFEETVRVFRNGGDAPAQKVAPHVHFYIAAASSEVEEEAKKRGWWQTLLDAGAEPLPPGCGACIGLGKGTLEPGEVGISATNRNFKGRMGSRDAQCYLASPTIVAASAIKGHIAAPFSAADIETTGECVVHSKPKAKPQPVRIIEGFPKTVSGRALYLPQDNLNTDGIYGKDVTYRDDITMEQQGQYAMLNYDPDFQEIARTGDIIVAARNFGTGSSREQAATALASKGIQLVIAASFSETYARNAYNNGFMCILCPDLVEFLAERLGDGAKTIPGPEITVDFENSTIACEGRSFDFPPLSPVAQELVAAGGSEKVVRQRLASSG